jgi:hypothetical protein
VKHVQKRSKTFPTLQEQKTNGDLCGSAETCSLLGEREKSDGICIKLPLAVIASEAQ